MTPASTTIAIRCEQVKIIILFGQIGKKYNISNKICILMGCGILVGISLGVPQDEKG